MAESEHRPFPLVPPKLLTPATIGRSLPRGLCYNIELVTAGTSSENMLNLPGSVSPKRCDGNQRLLVPTGVFFSTCNATVPANHQPCKR